MVPPPLHSQSRQTPSAAVLSPHRSPVASLTAASGASVPAENPFYLTAISEHTPGEGYGRGSIRPSLQSSQQLRMAHGPFWRFSTAETAGCVPSPRIPWSERLECLQSRACSSKQQLNAFP
ncbi:unnamed protein product [Cuscuta epithymum]|uniref:Uncharacterized protein n=1 Tax=Cuscuta epithymum TaxID=186058 RepID=A0AAV0G9N1_9ASTE|nr:unnamed protein product [Cuscuta epithymum]